MFLITGATGFIGQEIVRHLLAKGQAPHDNMVILVRNLNKLARELPELAGAPNTPAGNKPPRVHVVTGDLFNLDGLTPYIPQITQVIHVAGLIMSHRPADFYRVNAEGTRRLHQFIHDNRPKNAPPVRWIQISSLAANGPVGLSPQEIDPYKDQDAPICHYGKSKLEADRYMRMAHPPSELVIVRPPIVFGKEDRAWLPFFKLIKRRIMPVWRSDPIPRFSLVDVENLIECLWKLTRAAKLPEYSIYPTLARDVHWNELITMWGHAVHDTSTPSYFKLPIKRSFLKCAGRCVRTLSAIPWLARRLRFTEDKIKEMTAVHWVKDGRLQMNDLGIRVQPSAVEMWRTCVLQWHKNGWL